MAKNPYSPGVGTRPPYLAGREPQVRRFTRLLEDYPEKRNNLRISGLRGVGKTVLLKEYERMAAFVAVQDEDDDPMPVMLVLCGLPPLVGNVHRARSNAERLFKAEQIANLPLEVNGDGSLSEAALALSKPAEESGDICFTAAAAERIAADVDGYPFFVQWFGEALWDAADLDGLHASPSTAP